MRFEQALSRPMDPSTGPWGDFGRSSPYAGDAAGSSGRPARDYRATVTGANSTVSALAVFLGSL